MKVILDIKESKVAFVLELLKNFSFVKVNPISEEKAELMNNIKEAVQELNAIKRGELKGIPAKDLLDEL